MSARLVRIAVANDDSKTRDCAVYHLFKAKNAGGLECVACASKFNDTAFLAVECIAELGRNDVLKKISKSAKWQYLRHHANSLADQKINAHSKTTGGVLNGKTR